MNLIPDAKYKDEVYTVNELENLAITDEKIFLKVVSSLACTGCGAKMLFINNANNIGRSSFIRISSRKTQNHSSECKYFMMTMRRGNSGISGSRELTSSEGYEKLKGMNHKLTPDNNKRGKKNNGNRNKKEKKAILSGGNSGDSVVAAAPGQGITGTVDETKTPRIRSSQDTSFFEASLLGKPVKVLDYVRSIDVYDTEDSAIVITLQKGRLLKSKIEFMRSSGMDLNTWKSIARVLNGNINGNNLEIKAIAVVEKDTKGILVGGLYEYSNLRFALITQQKRLFNMSLAAQFITALETRV